MAFSTSENKIMPTPTLPTLSMRFLMMREIQFRLTTSVLPKVIIFAVVAKI